MDKNRAIFLWAQIQFRLEAWHPEWKSSVESLNQLSMARKRKAEVPFSDAEIFEGMLKAVLSNATNWQRVMENLSVLPELFSDFSLASYAGKSNDYVAETLMPWFRGRKAASLTLKADLERLILTSRKLHEWSLAYGSADSFFDTVIREAEHDMVKAVELLGTPGSRYKLPGMGMPLAAEALKNIGYEVAKPDRHICRALGCFGLVAFNNWPNQTATKAPISNPNELVASMRTIEKMAAAVGQTPSYVDQAIWLLCAKMGPYLSNDALRSMAAN
jgi:hypothetical protein